MPVNIAIRGVRMAAPLELVPRPRFYDLATADGVPYRQIALLHGADVLASTVVQTCIRYGEADRCRFCAIEESLHAGSTVAAKTPDQLAEVAEAAVRLDGIRQLGLTTGTPARPDRGRPASGSVRAGRAGGGPRAADPGAVRAASRPVGAAGPARRR